MAGPTVTLPAVVNAPILPVHKWMAGDDIVFRHTAVDADGAVRNIVGWTLEFLLREYPDDPDIVLTKAPAIFSAAGGTFDTTIADTDTVAIRPGRYWYVTRRTNADAEETINYGWATLGRSGGS